MIRSTRSLGVWGAVLVSLLPTAAALMQEGAAAEAAVPNTTDFLLLGLAIVALVIGVWVARLIVRFRALRQDAATLEALEGEGDHPR